MSVPLSRFRGQPLLDKSGARERTMETGERGEVSKDLVEISELLLLHVYIVSLRSFYRREEGREGGGEREREREKRSTQSRSIERNQLGISR